MDLAFLRPLFSPFSGRVLFAGFSGGADSTAALLCAASLAEELSFTLIAVHMNHHLRGDESDKEAREAGIFARERNISFQEISLCIAPGNGMEERARQARIDAWKKLTANHPGSAVILGHHAGDRVETLLLRLGRGVNLSGAVGLRMRSEVEGVTFLRPIYHWSRSEVENFLRGKGITSWAEDSSNSEPVTPRNILRNRILPELCQLYPGKEKGIVRSLDLWEKDAEFLEKMAQERIESGEAGKISFWANTPSVLRCRMLRFLWEKRGDSGIFSHETLDRFQSALASGMRGRIPLGKGRCAILFRDKIRFAVDRETPAPSAWHWQEKKHCRFGQWLFTLSTVSQREETDGEKIAFFPQETLPELLFLAFPEAGEKMIPWGRQNPVPLKKLRVQAHCPATLIPPLLKTPSGEVLWIPGIRRSALFPVAGPGKIVKFSASISCLPSPPDKWPNESKAGFSLPSGIK